MAEITQKRLAKPGLTVELVKGEQWTDDLSGISLYRGFYQLASHKEMTSKEIREKGYYRVDEKKPTAVIPEKDEKALTRVEKALRLGILKIYDPENPMEYVERGPGQARSVYDERSAQGFRSRDAIDEKNTQFLKLKLDKFKLKVNELKTLSQLQALYEAECSGRNPEARARKPYVDVINARMLAPDVGGVGRIKSRVEEKVTITN